MGQTSAGLVVVLPVGRATGLEVLTAVGPAVLTAVGLAVLPEVGPAVLPEVGPAVGRAAGGDPPPGLRYTQPCLEVESPFTP